MQDLTDGTFQTYGNKSKVDPLSKEGVKRPSFDELYAAFHQEENQTKIAKGEQHGKTQEETN